MSEAPAKILLRDVIRPIPGLENALIAVSFFRRRHRRGKRGRDLGHYRDSVRISLHYLYEARRDGWRGSIRAALKL
jgi:hypothetical protein